jgi:hypothetical protein
VKRFLDNSNQQIRKVSEVEGRRAGEVLGRQLDSSIP